CSGQTCLYYEVTLDREWERPVLTGSGAKKETGSTRVTPSRRGAIFQLGDGPIGKPPWGPLILSQNGRLALLAAARRRAMTLLLVGAAFTAGSIPAFLLGR